MSTLLNSSTIRFLFLSVVTLVLHARIFTTDIAGPHAWRQTQTVATIEQFARNSFDITEPHTYHYDYISGTNRMRMEFPLLQWIVAAFFRLCGEHLWLLRALLFIVGLIAVAGMWKLAREIFSDSGAAFIAGWTFCFSPLFYYYSINPLPDLLALCFAIWGLVWFFRWSKNQNYGALFFCVALFALATLCKLPYIIFYAVFGGWFLNVLRSRGVQWKNTFIVIAATVVSLAIALSWYAVVMKEWSPNKVTSGIFGEDFSAGNLFEILTGNLISTLPELLLNYAAVPLFIAGLYFFFTRKKKQNPHALPLIMLSVAVLLYYIFELNAITLVHDYYMLPFLPVLFLVVTYGAMQLRSKGTWQRVAMWILVLATPLMAFLRIDSRWNEQDPGFNPDLIAYKDQLRNAVPSGSKIVIGNDESAHISLYYTQHFGWNFHSDKLRVDEIETMIAQGATYLYSDSRIVESDPSLQPYFGDTVATIGSFLIIELKTPILNREGTTFYKRDNGLVH